MKKTSCSSCGNPLQGIESFCPRCGQALSGEKVGRRGDPEAPRWLEIEFQKSHSPSYAAALELCRTNPSYRTEERDGLTIHRVGFRAADSSAFLRLANLVRGWKSFRLYVNGREESWRSFFYGGYYCYEDRQSSPNPNQYCFGESCEWFNWWGCHRLGFGFYNEDDWMRSGHMTEDEVFVLDKDRLRRLLLSRLRSHAFCPIINRKAILERIDLLPDRIDPRANPDWEYYYLDWREDPNTPPAAAVPICHQTSSLVTRMVPPDVEIPSPPDRGAWTPGGEMPGFGPEDF
ncbi:MAG: hypothetical protein FJY73_13640 [Candidatus Eisenbacteria bacterium]|nr:hypothetical protein [Candidatus Eisenbacteria bacterium]